MSSHASIRLHHPHLPTEAGAAVTIDSKQAHYLLHVMRASTGDSINLFSNDAGEWSANITQCSKKSVTLTLTQQIKAPQPLPALCLCFAPIKHAHMAIMIEKATELGIGHLQPIITDHTVVRQPNLEKLAAYAIEAAEQCERPHVPTLHAPAPLSEWLANHKSAILWGDESGTGTDLTQLLAQHSSPPQHILIGPEGGFSAAEQSLLAESSMVQPYGLGPLILRADTAAITTIAVHQAHSGYFQQPPHFSINRAITS